MYPFFAVALFLIPSLGAQNQSAIASNNGIVDEAQEKDEVIEMPRFPGCEDDESLSSRDRQRCAEVKLMEFIAEHVQYPMKAKENIIEGTVVVQFVVDKNGQVKNEHIVRDIGEGCGEEAQRIVALMREENIRWIPGKKNGEAVNVQFNLPILFHLESRKDRKEKRKKNKKSKH